MKKWTGNEVNKDRIKEIHENAGFNMILSALISNRFEDEYKSALNINVEDLDDPFKLQDMDKAVDRVIEAIEAGEQVLIYGDYDADGITSTSILYSFLSDQGLHPSYYIPNRLTEGYGMNKKALKEFKELGYTLIITVDNGIVAFEEAEYAKELGIDLLITDHHELQDDKIPSALAVVDPKRPGYTGFKDIAGCFVAYKLVQAVCDSLGITEDYYRRFLSIVAIGSIGDVMPLKSENRIAVSYGIENMPKLPNYGLDALYNLVFKLPKDRFSEITAEKIAFQIVPRLNASGRLGSDAGAELMTSNDEYEAKDKAMELEKLNIQRKEITALGVKEALDIIGKDDLHLNNVIVVSSENFNEGVIGIIAANISEKFGRPSLVLAVDGDMAKGSGRAPEGQSIFSIVSEAKGLCEKFGGHERALGLSIKTSNLDKFKEKIYSVKTEETDKIVSYDMLLKFKHLSMPLLSSFSVLEPFGEENPKPTFMFKNILVKKIYESEKVINVLLEDDGTGLFGYTFNKKDFEGISEGDNVMLIGRPEINSYNGKDSIKIYIVDIEKV